MPIWSLPPVSSEPCIRLLEWRIFEIVPQRTRHFVGLNIGDRTRRVSSAVLEFDSEALRGVTRSGRIYTLVGPTGYSDDAQYVWQRWCSANGVQQSTDVTSRIVSWSEDDNR
jgi:hypothetical protein